MLQKVLRLSHSYVLLIKILLHFYRFLEVPLYRQNKFLNLKVVHSWMELDSSS